MHQTPKIKKIIGELHKASRTHKGQAERLACWDYIMNDEEMAYLIGNSNVEKGKAMMNAMKEANALDISGDGQVCNF